jgi:alpha-glucosidase (family GH31 glycosyl hydrolase)
VPLNDGLLARAGWYLLDDSQTAVMGGDGWPEARTAAMGGYQDGYFLGYGSEYKTALRDYYRIAGPPVMLPRWAFGVWFSRYYPHSDQDYRSDLLPNFRSHRVPLDVIVIDTDWKSPVPWNGWNWNTLLFPQPSDFMNWTRQQGLKIALNIHPSIQSFDPQYGSASAAAGGLIDLGTGRFGWDWGLKPHVVSYFDLHKPFNQQGVRAWWLDWCCEGAPVSVPGLAGDVWINTLYAKNATDQGLRGFAFSRIGPGYDSYGGRGRSGAAWGEHRNTVHFTGDTYSTWDMLAFESYYTLSEANIGLPYVSHDLGGFHGLVLSDDMYIRWVQFGVFQPILRLHSDHGLRLPWEYPNVASQAADWLRLRHALIPYTYSFAHESAMGGLPIVRATYLEYPQSEEAYAYATQYMFGDEMLVSPIVNSGAYASTRVWFPPGVWTDFFTREVHSGPRTETVWAGYDGMPVYVKAGGIVPMQGYMDYDGQQPADPLILWVYPGADGSFMLYEDEGDNLDYGVGRYALTAIRFSDNDKKLTVRAQRGSYPGQLSERSYDVRFVNASKPSAVAVNGTSLDEISAGKGEGWWYDAHSLRVHINARSTASDVELTYSGP